MSWTKVGNVVKKKDKEGYFFAFDDKVEITINGKKVTNPFLNVEKPIDKYERMFKFGKITEEEYEEKKIKYDGSRIQLELILPPQD